MLTPLNHTFIVLIPKIDTASMLEEYRPISCLSVTYKLISKILANRICAVLCNLVHPNQAAFVKGRTSDCINLAQEFTKGFNNKSTSMRVCITIDFRKAFDTVKWDAIDKILELLGFDELFREMVMTCVTSSSFLVLFDGSPADVFQAQQGLRQGDLLSPILFVIVIELSWQWRREDWNFA